MVGGANTTQNAGQGNRSSAMYVHAAEHGRQQKADFIKIVLCVCVTYPVVPLHS